MGEVAVLSAVDLLALHAGLFAADVGELALDEAGKIGYAYKCVGSAFWALRSGLPFREAVCAVVAEAGDADTNAAIAGAMVGAAVGYDALPDSWLNAMPHKAFLDDHVAQLLAKWVPTLPEEWREQ